MWWRPPRCWPRRAASRSTRSARQTTENFFRLFSKVPRPRRQRCALHDADVHHSGLRLVRRRAAAGARLGRLRSEQSEEPPPPQLAAGRAQRTPDGVTRVLVDTSPDLREQLLDANVDWARRRAVHPRARRPHPRHRRPARPVHQPPQARRRLCSTNATSRMLHARFSYCFATAARQRISADRARAPHGGRRAGHGRRGRAAPSRPCRSSRSMATSPRSASASARSAYSCDLSGLPADSVAALAGLDVWIVDALRYKPHPSHFSVAEALAWIERLKPQARDPDQPAHRPRLRGVARAAAGACRAGLRRDADRAVAPQIGCFLLISTDRLMRSRRRSCI